MKAKNDLICCTGKWPKVEESEHQRGESAKGRLVVSTMRKGKRMQAESCLYPKAATKSKGFTLIEVLVVIGIIAILAAVVLVAINPARQFKLARDSQRVSNVNAILNAVHQNIAEHHGTFVCNGAVKALPIVVRTVKYSASAPESEGDIATCIVPDYISSLPFDPSIPTAHYSSVIDYDTGYVIYQDSNSRITASSTGELTPSISVTR